MWPSRVEPLPTPHPQHVGAMLPPTLPSGGGTHLCTDLLGLGCVLSFPVFLPSFSFPSFAFLHTFFCSLSFAVCFRSKNMFSKNWFLERLAVCSFELIYASYPRKAHKIVTLAILRKAQPMLGSMLVYTTKIEIDARCMPKLEVVKVGLLLLAQHLQFC